jgi:glutamyl-tRNA reductase
MKLRLTGINHQSAPVSVREKAAISSEKLPTALSALQAYVPHGIILSTCNRTEIYTIESDAFDVKKASLAFIKERSGADESGMLNYLYQYKEKKVAEHLFRVASGLESMVVGEFEILGQTKAALEAAEKSGMVNLPLRQLFHSAIGTGRRVRAETGISRNALSVSSVAVDFAADILGDLSACKMLIIGTGQAGKLVARVAEERGIKDVTIASRTRERASQLAGMLNGRPISLENLPAELGRANIVITCAGAPHWLLDKNSVAKVVHGRPGVPLVIIDIALPRNVDPGVAGLPDVFLYNIDDLNRVSGDNRQQRQLEIRHAEDIIKREIDGFATWWQQYQVRPTVSAIMSRAEQVRQAQLTKTLSKLPPLTDEQVESLDSMTRSIVTKILKDPVHYLKTNESSDQIKLIREIFRLDGEGRP